MKSKKVILIGGFIRCGKTAFTDFFLEFDNISVPDRALELIFISNPDGLLSLETELINNWDPFHSDISIKRFRELIINLTHKYNSPYFYKSFNETFCTNFEKISFEFVDELTDFTFNGIWYGINNPLYKVTNKINRIVKNDIFKFLKTNYISYPKEKFYSLVRNYFNRLIEDSSDRSSDFVVLMEPYAALNVERVLRFFDDAKMLVIIRDPRDVFVNLKRDQTEYFPIEDVEQFIALHVNLYDKYSNQNYNNKNVLTVYFEDLVLNYEKTSKSILQFYGIEEKHHVSKRKSFNPDISVKNLQMYKGYANQGNIKLIKKKLNDFCYKFSDD